MIQKELCSEFASLYTNEGLSETKIAERYGISRRGVRGALDRAGVDRRKRGWGRRPEKRRCRDCRKRKPLGAFVRRGDGKNHGYTYDCRDCWAAKARAEWRPLQKYGLTKADYDALVRKQRGVCAICRKPPIRRFDVDHCHSTQNVRGLLCRGCNILVGVLERGPEIIRRAMNYLR